MVAKETVRHASPQHYPMPRTPCLSQTESRYETTKVEVKGGPSQNNASPGRPDPCCKLCCNASSFSAIAKEAALTAVRTYGKTDIQGRATRRKTGKNEASAELKLGYTSYRQRGRKSRHFLLPRKMRPEEEGRKKESVARCSCRCQCNGWVLPRLCHPGPAAPPPKVKRKPLLWLDGCAINAFYTAILFPQSLLLPPSRSFAIVSPRFSTALNQALSFSH